jgi:hypothetical protein
VKESKRKRRISREGRAASARAGAENLRRWKEGQVAEVTKIARDRIAEFEKTLRGEFTEGSPIVAGLVESAVTSYRSLIQASSLQSLGSRRLDRIERIHAVLIEAQRNLFRALKVLLNVQGTPEYRAAALRRITATIPTLTEEDRKSAEEAATKRLEENKARFACLEEGYDGPPPPNEHH